MVESRSRIKDIIGYAAFVNQDCFSSTLFSNIVTASMFLPVFRRETKNGLYSVHVYYFGNLLAKMMTFGFYPVLLVSLTYYFMDSPSKSLDTYLYLLKVGVALSFNSVSLGHMLSNVSSNDSVVASLAFMAMQVIATMAGQTINNNTPNLFVQILSSLSPMRYSLELFLRGYLKTAASKDFILNIFGFTAGEQFCFGFLLCQALVFSLCGYLVLAYKSKYVF